MRRDYFPTCTSIFTGLTFSVFQFLLTPVCSPTLAQSGHGVEEVGVLVAGVSCPLAWQRGNQQKQSPQCTSQDDLPFPCAEDKTKGIKPTKVKAILFGTGFLNTVLPSCSRVLTAMICHLRWQRALQKP